LHRIAHLCKLKGQNGEVAERFKAAVLKTAVPCKRAVGSNPTLSANGRQEAVSCRVFFFRGPCGLLVDSMRGCYHHLERSGRAPRGCRRAPGERVNKMTHEEYMREALREAAAAAAIGEVPIGAVIVKDGQIIARAHNLRESNHDATAHAEILAIRQAGQLLGGWRLTGCTLYVTVEPCPMCAGALVQSRVDQVVFGASDPKAWADRKLTEIVQNPGLNHRLEVTGGVLAEECSEIIRAFFRARRATARGAREGNGVDG
jgi:tRNA(adenine34) deaminase